MAKAYEYRIITTTGSVHLFYTKKDAMKDIKTLVTNGVPFIFDRNVVDLTEVQAEKIIYDKPEE